MSPFLRKFFDENYKLVKKRSSQLSLQIETHPYSELEVSYLSDGSPNLLTKDGFFLHTEGENFSFNTEAEVVYVYGLGLGYAYRYLKNWLREREDRELLFLEDDLLVMQYFLASEGAREILSDPQIQVYYLPPDKERYEELLGRITTLYHTCKVDFISLFSYKKYKDVVADRLEKYVMAESLKKHLYMAEILHSSQKYYDNYYHNIFSMPGAHIGNDLKGAFEGVPVIICGAGPSLDKQLARVKELRSRALLFAGGSAINALTARSIIPDFGGTIDPNAAQARRIAKNNSEEMPYFYHNRVHKDVLGKIEGPKIFMSGCSDYYLPNWFNEQLGLIEKDSESYDDGYNVISFLTYLATFLGCNPIIFIGMDLAYTNKKSYSSSVYAVRDISEGGKYPASDKPIPGKDIYGDKTDTCWKWIDESDWYKGFQEGHLDYNFINATEGGLGFSGIENKPLQNVAEEYLQNNFNLKEMISEALLSSELCNNINNDDIFRIMGELEGSLLRSIVFLKEILLKIESLDGKGRADLKYDDMHSTIGVLAEQKLFEEVAYKYILFLQNRAFDLSLRRHYNRLIMLHDEDRHGYIKLNIYQRNLKNMLELAFLNLEALKKAVDIKVCKNDILNKK